MNPGDLSSNALADDRERALRDSELRLQQVLDNTSAAVFAKDRSGRYLFVNREFERLTGHGAAALIGRRDRDIFPAEQAAGLRRNDMRVLLEARAMEFEESGVFAGEQRTYLSAKFPLLDCDGVPYAVCGIATDITRRKQIETALSSSALAVSNARGRDLFVELSRYLGAILDVDVSFIAEMREEDPGMMRVLAFVADSAPRENFDYALANTACDTVVGHGFRIYPAGLGNLFPLDDDFIELGAEGYAGYPLTDTQGRPLGLISIVSRRPLEQAEFIESVMKIFAVRASAEIERQRADAALLASQVSYRQIFEASEDAIIVYDQATDRIVDVNPKACVTSGYSHDELLHIAVDHLGSGEAPYTGADAAIHLQHAREHGSARFEWRRRNKDGSLYWDEVFLKSASIGGEPRILAFTRDITERKLAEEAAQRNAEHLRATVSAALDCIIAMDEHGTIIKFNPAAETCFGYREREALGQSLAELIIPERYRERHRQGMQRFLSGGPGPYLQRRLEVTALRADGSEFPAELAIGVDESPSGRIFIGYLRDITERIEAEQRRCRLEAQLLQAKKMEALGHLTGGIAHDFNNLLASIMGYVAMASERSAGGGDARLENYLGHALQSCERARDLIQQMLMFSRGQKGEPRLLDPAQCIEQNLAVLRPSIPCEVDVVVDTVGRAGAICFDPVQFGQVMLNLCLNACDAMQGQGRLDIGLHETSEDGRLCSACQQPVSGTFVEIAIGDTGPGIEPAVLERIFDPFFSTKPPGKGAGMGLATVHGIVHEHGGHLVVESEPGRGTRFRVLLPICEAEAGEAVQQQPASAPSTNPRLQGRVLVVDDERSVGEFMCELLSSWGLEADFVAAPAQALERVRQAPEHYQLLITDHSMPSITGIQLAQSLQAVAPELPVLLYTGLADRVSEQALPANMLKTVLRKPIDHAHLARELSAILRSTVT
ncbi:PAS domain S-box protein [Lysobacter sp. S4-A87]|uniref:PAS domain-containing hybrid sensor histidine kinase/response regulator n=1 Tax=Lysobacter sp. S4-A87 TaxID=2925843 RepID=UPI001F53DDCC|nr:PAS domain S-box protein [Lysobacter sp. S4-A87]UNK49344.1 PAS domain S-box protein [Lysobacter sp. S4-A87]